MAPEKRAKKDKKQQKRNNGLRRIATVEIEQSLNSMHQPKHYTLHYHGLRLGPSELGRRQLQKDHYYLIHSYLSDDKNIHTTSENLTQTWFRGQKGHRRQEDTFPYYLGWFYNSVQYGQLGRKGKINPLSRTVLISSDCSCRMWMKIIMYLTISW